MHSPEIIALLPNQATSDTMGTSWIISGVGDRYDHRVDTDYYTQPGNLFRLMTPNQQARLIDNFVQDMKPVSRYV